MSRHVSITPERDDNMLRKFLRFIHWPAFKRVFKTMLRVPVTDLYHPAKDHSHYPSVSHRYRGLLALSQKACTGCKKCERICPNNTIIMETREIDGDEYRFPGYFSGRCMKCGLCEEVCDRQWAIRHTDQWEDAGFSREQLYYGPERMFEMWRKHIQPRIDAGLAHKSVPDKRRWDRDTVDDASVEPPEPKVPDEFQKKVNSTDYSEEKAFNSPVGRYKDQDRMWGNPVKVSNEPEAE